MSVAVKPWFRCWEPKEVKDAIFSDVSTFQSNESALFLAGYVDLPAGIEKGPIKRKRNESTCQMISRALHQSRGEKQNTLIAVVGPAGCGKTYLVRWVHEHMDKSDTETCLIYVPKQSNTLKEIISLILRELPNSESVEKARKSLELAINEDAVWEVKEKLFTQLRIKLGKLEEEPRNAADWSTDDLDRRRAIIGPSETSGKRGGISNLLLDRNLSDHLQREGGSFSRIVDYMTQQRRAGEEAPQFDDEDFDLNKSKVDTTDRSQAERDSWLAIREDKQLAASVLNEALADAMSATLGFDENVSIVEVFNDARRMLRDQGKELVLIFEDLAQLGPIQKALYDQFRAQPGSDMAPIRALFAITTGRFSELDVTTSRVVNYQFSMDSLDLYADDQRELVRLLVGRYLNIARLGRKRILSAFQSREAKSSEDWVPNKCLDFDGKGSPCSYVDRCHEGFGSVEDYGTFPYNAKAFENALRKVEASSILDKGTAGVIIDRLVHDFLLTAHIEMEGKNYPSGMETIFDFTQQRPNDAIVQGIDPGASEEAKTRLRQTRVVYSAERPEDDVITAWFSLPTQEEPFVEVAVHEPIADPPSNDQNPQIKPTVVSKFQKEIQQITNWGNKNGDLPNDLIDGCRTALYDAVVARVRFDDFLIDMGQDVAKRFINGSLKDYENGFFNRFSFLIADFGQNNRPGFLEFDLSEGTPDNAKLLTAMHWWRTYGHWDASDQDGKVQMDQNSLDEARIHLDSYVFQCANQVRERLQQMGVSHGEIAKEVVRIRMMALAVKGLINLEDSIDDVLRIVIDRSFDTSGTSYSSEWRQVVAVADRVLADLGIEWIEAFGMVRQGRGEILGMSATILMEACQDAMNFLKGGVDVPRFSDQGGILDSCRSEIEEAILNNAGDEGERLSATLDVLNQLLSEKVLEAMRSGNPEPFRDLIKDIQNVTTVTIAQRLFSPNDVVSEFDRTLQALRDIPVQTLRIAAIAANGVPRGLALGEILGIQREVGSVLTLCDDINWIKGPLTETTEAISSILNGSASVEGESSADAVLAELLAISELLAAGSMEGSQ